MKLSRDAHSHFQGLISARLDGALAASDELDLAEHLAECSTCRSAARDYRAQHAALASLPPRPAPRDLWARTAAALDREMARQPQPSDRKRARQGSNGSLRPAPGSRWLGLTAATSVLLAGAVIATQMRATVAPTTDAATLAARATPFEVTPQDMSVFDVTAGGVAVYQTRVSQACPPPSIDCTDVQLPSLPVIQINGNAASNRGLTMNSHSGKLAFVSGGDEGAETVSVVTLPPFKDPTAAGAGAHDTPTPEPVITSQPTDAVTPAPTDTPDVNPTPIPTASPTNTRPTDNPTPTAPRTPEPDKTPKATPQPSQPTASTSPDASSDPGSSEPPAATPSAVPSDPNASPQPADAALAIAEGVRLVGAAPAWSLEGDKLAFSAEPADLSTGPDLYLWRVGDPKAVRLTGDHRSYFASWDGDRIVISRLTTDATGSQAAVGPVNADTVVMDLSSGKERVASGPSLWLPSVEPTGRFAVAWMGRLRSDGTQATPRAGGLYLLDWAAIDPFAAPSQTPVAATEPPASEPPTPPVATPTPANATQDPTPGVTRKPHRRSPSPSLPPASDVPPTDEPAATPAPQTVAPPTTAAADAALSAIDPQRDETADPVLDWVVRWSADGNTVGVWVADAPTSNWGHLSVIGVTLDAGTFDRHALLGPSLAQRAFSLGVDRVAWVAPSDSGSDGELRMRVWNASGYGDVRIHSTDAGDGVPSF